MLAGEEMAVKADRMLCRFVADANDKQNINPDHARKAVLAAADILVKEFPNLTPRRLDYRIWSYQQKNHSPDCHLKF